MAQTLFLGPTYPARSKNIASDRCINLYPETSPPDVKGQQHPSANGGVISLIGTPGASFAFQTSASVIRGMHVFNNFLYFVASNKLYSLDALGTMSAALGTLATSTGRVTIIDNGITGFGGGPANQLFIVDGTATGYIYNTSSATFSTTQGGVIATYIEGYFITNLPNSIIVAASDPLDGTLAHWNPGAIAANLGSSDNVQAVVNFNNQLWMVKQFNTQIWGNNGLSPALGNFPYSLLQGGVIDYGTESPYSVARADQALFFVANVRQGDSGKFAGIMMIQGNTPQIISPASINYQISQYGDISDAFGYCRVHEGHSFYVCTFPSANGGLGATWVYDRTTNMFHEWSSYVTPYQVARHFSNCYAFFNHKEYIGDFSTGNIYELSSNVFEDNGDPIVSVRICQHQYDRKSLDNIFIMRLQVDMETGVGDSQVITQTGIDPQAQLAWSNDGGHTYGNDYLASIGAVGLYRTRLIWRRLGYARDRVFRLIISDPIKKSIVGVYVND